MSFNLLASAPGSLDWRALHDAAAPGLTLVELFPVPAESPQAGDALGIAVPGRHATPQGWEELGNLFERLRPFGLAIVELYSGLRVSGDTLPKIRDLFLGSGA